MRHKELVFVFDRSDAFLLESPYNSVFEVMSCIAGKGDLRKVTAFTRSEVACLYRFTKDDEIFFIMVPRKFIDVKVFEERIGDYHLAYNLLAKQAPSLRKLQMDNLPEGVFYIAVSVEDCISLKLIYG